MDYLTTLLALATSVLGIISFLCNKNKVAVFAVVSFFVLLFFLSHKAIYYTYHDGYMWICFGIGVLSLLGLLCYALYCRKRKTETPDPQHLWLTAIAFLPAFSILFKYTIFKDIVINLASNADIEKYMEFVNSLKINFSGFKEEVFVQANVFLLYFFRFIGNLLAVISVGIGVIWMKRYFSSVFWSGNAYEFNQSKNMARKLAAIVILSVIFSSGVFYLILDALP